MNVNSDITTHPQPHPRIMATDAASLAAEVMRRCDLLAQCSEDSDRITRRFLTPPMREVHALLAEWMHVQNMTTRIDDLGNFIGRLEGAPGGRTLIIGSHLDTVPGAGRYDGVLGVAIALALVEALGGQPLPFHLDVIGFSEEEGVRFSEPYLGSSATAGCFKEDWFEHIDSDGVSLRDAIHSYGGKPDCIERCAYQAEEVIGYIEPHLEQGPVLERLSQPVGVVTSIVGQSRISLEFIGEEGHAGTSPMSGRSDALVAAAEFVSSVRKITSQCDELRATVGKLHVHPNAANVIPGKVSLSLDVRHASDASRRNAVAQLLDDAKSIAVREGCDVQVLRTTDQQAVNMDDKLTTHLSQAANEVAGVAPTLCSGAGHDAVVMSQRFPVAMLFLRHPGGVSHSPEERVEADDVASAIEVLARAVLQLAKSTDSF